MSTSNLFNFSFHINISWANIEAVLQCMKKLSQGLPVEEAYMPIDIQNPDVPCIHFDMELSGWQNYSVASIIGT